jgi:hypothetical protein
VDIPHEEEVNNNKKDFNYFKEEGFEIQDLEAEVLETTLEEDGNNKCHNPIFDHFILIIIIISFTEKDKIIMIKIIMIKKKGKMR